METLTTWLFAGVSFLAGLLNFIFLRRSLKRNVALLETKSEDPILHRISRGFIFVWSFIVFDDLIRVVVGIGLLGHIPGAGFLLLLAPFGSLLVAIVGLRSFR